MFFQKISDIRRMLSNHIDANTNVFCSHQHQHVAACGSTCTARSRWLRTREGLGKKPSTTGPVSTQSVPQCACSKMESLVAAAQAQAHVIIWLPQKDGQVSCQILGLDLWDDLWACTSLSYLYLTTQLQLGFKNRMQQIKADQAEVFFVYLIQLFLLYNMF